MAKTGRMIYIRDACRSSVITEFDFKMDWISAPHLSISIPEDQGRDHQSCRAIPPRRNSSSVSDIKMFVSFASRASIIIENARLHEQAGENRTADVPPCRQRKDERHAPDLNKRVDIITSPHSVLRKAAARCS